MKRSAYILILFLLADAVTFCRAQTPPLNEELAKAAKEGKIFEGHKYFVIAENNTEMIRPTPGDTIRKKLQRGTVVQEPSNRTGSPKGYRAVQLPGETEVWYLKYDSPVIHQYGPLRFPVAGVVQAKTVFQYYDHETKTSKEVKVKKGTLYFWVIKKDGHYVNVLDADGKSRTGYLKEEHLNIIQKADHLKVMPESTRKNIRKLWE